MFDPGAGEATDLRFGPGHQKVSHAGAQRWARSQVGIGHEQVRQIGEPRLELDATDGPAQAQPDIFVGRAAHRKGVQRAAQWAGQKKLAPLARRVLVYLGNLDSGDSVDVAGRSDALDIYRDDGQRIAHVITARHDHSQVPTVATRGTASVPT